MIYINNLFYTIVSQVGRRRRVLPFLDTTRDGNLPLKWQGGCENGSLSLLEVHVFGKCPKTYTLVLLLMYSTLVWSLTLTRAQDDPAEILTPSLYSDVPGEVLFGQSLVLIWPWLHINSDKHHFLCSHFIGLFLISIFPGCFLWGCPRRSLGTWTSSWRRRGATKRSSKATGLATSMKPTPCPSWCEKILSWFVFVLYDASTTGCIWKSQVESCFEWKHVWLCLPSRTFKTYSVFHFAYICWEYFREVCR